VGRLLLNERSYHPNGFPQDNELYDLHLGNDCHSLLNVPTNLGTWEYRLWNSTCMAWRMDLWCRLSLLMVHRPFVVALLDEDPEHWWDDTFLDLVLQHDDTAADLLVRQFDYLNNRAASAPLLLTA